MLSEVPGSVIAASMLDDGLHAVVQMPDGKRHWIEPIGTCVFGARPGQYVVYGDNDILVHGATCANDGAAAAHIGPVIESREFGNSPSAVDDRSDKLRSLRFRL